MTINTDLVRHRMQAANPASIEDEAPGDVMTADALLDLIDDRSGGMTREGDRQRQVSPVATRKLHRNWAAAFAAGFAMIVIAGITAGLLARGDTNLEHEAEGATSAVAPEGAERDPHGWDPILATTVARPSAPAATCSAGADPNAPGPAGQDQPHTGGDGVHAGAFDTHAGRIVYVDTSYKTWTFDVCTNTWQAMNATGATNGGLPGGMVYDIDSEVVVALGSGHVSVYDIDSNTWTWLPSDFLGSGVNQFAPSGGVYDPVSGLIVTTRITDEVVDVWTYNIDTNTATPIGRLNGPDGENLSGFELLGYSVEIDRLIFGSFKDTTALVDPRTGQTTLIETPTPGILRGWSTSQTSQAGDTVYVTLGDWHDGEGFRTRFPGQVCGFDSDAAAWTSCFEIRGGSLPYVFDTVVGDPINNRLVYIRGVNTNYGSDADGDVWTVGLDSGETTELLTPSDH